MVKWCLVFILFAELAVASSIFARETPAADDSPSEAAVNESNSPSSDAPADPAPAADLSGTDEAPANVSDADEAPANVSDTDEAPANGSEDKAAADTAKRYDLKYKFTPGEELRTEVVHRATVQTTIQGTSQTAETQSRSIKVWKISQVSPEGNATFMHMVESIDMRQHTQGRREIHFNSATDTEVPAGYEDVAKAVGVPLTIVTMDNRGTILKRQEKRVQPMSVSTQMTMPLPANSVSIGESWSSPADIEATLKDGGTRKIQTKQKFTLERVANDVAIISVDAQILTPINDPAIEAQVIQRMASGTVRFDIAAGRVLGQQLDLDRHVIGFSGPASSMHYVTRFSEKLLPVTAVARKQPAAAPPATAPAATAPKPTTPSKSATKGKASRR